MDTFSQEKQKEWRTVGISIAILWIDEKFKIKPIGMDKGSFHPENHSAQEWADVLRKKYEEVRSASCSG